MSAVINGKNQGLDETLAYVGCAGWSLPASFAGDFPDEGSHLERYATRFNGVEINSSFYRPHRLQTYMRWAATVPESFRFAVKIPRSITHENRLQNVDELLEKFLTEVTGLGARLGPLLVQLPPGLCFDHATATQFFSSLRQRFDGHVVCEPRHISWFAAQANELLMEYRVARAIADPAIVPQSSESRGWTGLAYYRMHGSPTIYHSAYSTEFLENLTMRIKQDSKNSTPIWCIFDNTAEGAATGNALELIERLR